MFVRLTRPVRAKAGWFVALLYLFCVLAPGVALALGDAASCLVQQFGTATPRMCMRVFSRNMRPRTSIMRCKRISTRWITPMPATPCPEHAKHQHGGKGSHRTMLRHDVRFGDRSRSACGRKARAADLALRLRRLPAPAG